MPPKKAAAAKKTASPKPSTATPRKSPTKSAENKPPTFQQIKCLTNEELAEWVSKAGHAFFNGHAIISDDLYDAIKDELEARDPNHPIFGEVGAVILEDREKVKLPYWMGSMDKVKAEPDVMKRFSAKYPGPYDVTDKLDGISGLLYWKDGKLSLYTRGDGKIGQDISHVLPHINFIPPKKAFAEFDEFAMRCELIMSKANWDANADLGSNPRNVVSGTLGAKTPTMTTLKLIDCIAYEWVSPGRFRQSEQLQKLAAMGFKTVNEVALDEVSVDSLSDVLLKRREKGKYVIDGIVVMQDALHERNTSGNPKYAFAFKSLITQDRAEVIVSHVEWNLSKDLYAKPLVHFNEVNIDGVKIKQATGFNAAFIQANAIGPGSHLIVIRAGDVIPHILEVITPSESGEPSMPTFNYVWNETHVDIMVDKNNQNKEVAEEIAIKEIVNFFNKVDVPGVSEGILKKLYAAGHTTIKSICNIDETQLLKVEGVKDKSATKIATALRESMASLTPMTLLVASNAHGRGFGERKFKLILEHLPSIVSARYVPTVDELVAIPGIEKKSAEAFIEGLPRFWKFVKDNNMERVFEASRAKSPSASPSAVASHKSPAAASLSPATKAKKASAAANVKDKAFVFTGFRDKDAEALIEEYGGRVASGVTKKVDYLVIKEAEGKKSSKVEKAEELGVSVLTRDELNAMLGM